MFPLLLPKNWYNAELDIDSVQRDQAKSWIQSQSSLTVKIKELGIAFELEVLSQVTKTLTDEFKSVLASNDDRAIFREVLLKQGGIPLVYAQTVIPESTVSGAEKGLQHLGNQPLGQVLFQSPQAIRGALEFAQVDRDSALGQFITAQLQQEIDQPCYIRRSNFLLNNKPLLVCECFLPALFE